MPSTSHAKCNNCGGNRHKAARLNLCRRCWNQLKPQVRQEWRDIKARRAARRHGEHMQSPQLAGEHYVQEVMIEPMPAKANGAPPQGTLADLFEQIRKDTLPKGQEEAAIARIRLEGVPAQGSPERGLYMQLFKGREPNNVLSEVVARLYSDSDVPIKDIMHAMAIDANELARIRRRRKLPTREDTVPFRPSARMSDTEELIYLDNQAMFRDTATGLMRPVWPAVPEAPIPEPEPAPPEPEPAPKPEPEPKPEPIPVAATAQRQSHTRRTPFTSAELNEIMAMYQDESIPMSEIETAYNTNAKSIYGIAHRMGVKGRRRGRKPMVTPEALGNVDTTRHLVVVNGPPPVHQPHQLHLGAAPGAALATNNVTERAWSISFVTTTTVLVNAPSVEEALRQLRERHGEVDIVSINRA